MKEHKNWQTFMMWAARKYRYDIRKLAIFKEKVEWFNQYCEKNSELFKIGGIFSFPDSRNIPIESKIGFTLVTKRCTGFLYPYLSYMPEKEKRRKVYFNLYYAKDNNYLMLLRGLDFLSYPYIYHVQTRNECRDAINSMPGHLYRKLIEVIESMYDLECIDLSELKKIFEEDRNKFE